MVVKIQQINQGGTDGLWKKSIFTYKRYITGAALSPDARLWMDARTYGIRE